MAEPQRTRIVTPEQAMPVLANRLAAVDPNPEPKRVRVAPTLPVPPLPAAPAGPSTIELPGALQQRLASDRVARGIRENNERLLKCSDHRFEPIVFTPDGKTA